MAVLSKIRQRGLLLVLVIGFCLLAFIVGDLFNSKKFGITSKNVGSINGKDITFDDFRVKVSDAEKGGQGVTATQASNRIWEQEIAIALLTTEFDKLGIRVGEKNIIDAFKNDQTIGQQPMFKNEKGEFDINKFREYFKANPAQAEFVKDKEKNAILNSKYQIYNTLVKGGLFTTDLDGKLKYEAETTTVNFDYVPVLFSSIKDSEAKVSDAELIDYMKKNEKKYKADENRELEYVLIEDKPSKADEDEVKNHVNLLLNGGTESKDSKLDTVQSFKTVSNVPEFVNMNSEIPYDSSYIPKKDLPKDLADALFNLPEGQVYGPYMHENYYCITRSMGRKSGASARASHILISYEGSQVPSKREKRTKEEAKAKAESLLAQVKANPQSMMMLALTNSDDGSSQKGGDLGYFGPGQMVPAFDKFVFDNPVGTIGLVETQFGFHIIDITDKQDAVRLATIAEKIEPSDATTDALYAKAVKVETDANEKDFDGVAKAEKLKVIPVTVKATDEAFGAVGNQRAIVQWAYSNDTEVGNVKRFEVANVGNVIVKLKKINPEGLLSIKEARISVEPILKNKKKAEIIKAKIKGGTLEAIAAATGSTVQSATGLTMERAMIPNAGPESKVVATAIVTPINKVSAPIEGNSGVYVVKPTLVTKAPAIKNYSDYSKKVHQMVASYSSRVIPALKADADIKDNRSKFNY
jgi:peptidyl-prolyl cis-trans isomerase D